MLAFQFFGFEIPMIAVAALVGLVLLVRVLKLAFGGRGGSVLAHKRIATKSGAREWGFVIASVALGAWAIWLANGGLGVRVGAALVGMIVFYMVGRRPTQCNQLLVTWTVFTIGAIAFIVIGSVAFFSSYREVIRGGLSIVYLLILSFVFRAAIRGLIVSPKHFGQHLRNGAVTGWLLLKSGPYFGLAFMDSHADIGEELGFEDETIQVEIGGKIPVDVPVFANFKADSNNFTDEGEVRFWMLGFDRVRESIMNALRPFVRRMAVIAQSVEEFNSNTDPISLAIRFKFETDVVPHESEEIAREVGWAGAVPVPDDKLFSFYKSPKLKAVFAREVKGDSETEKNFGIKFGASGVGIKDVVTTEEMRRALEASAIAVKRAEAAGKLKDIDPVLLELQMLGDGVKGISRNRVIIDGGSPLERAAAIVGGLPGLTGEGKEKK